MTEFKEKRVPSLPSHLQSSQILTKQRKLGSEQGFFPELHFPPSVRVSQVLLQEAFALISQTTACLTHSKFYCSVFA